ncbi:MAG: hypothetical protein ABI141_09745 [Gemmatimonadaceae bacterium]
MSETFIARRLLLSACVIVLVSACGDPVTGPATSGLSAAPNALRQASATVDISGVWPFHEDATFLLFDYAGQATKVFRCSSDGAYTFTQTGDTFTGSFDQVGVCTAADGTTFANNFTGSPVTEGTINGRQLSFLADGCQYEGALRGPTFSEMGGAGRCGGGGTFGTYRASWSAAR